jgi:DNA primase
MFTQEQIERARGTPIHALLGIQYSNRTVSIRCPFHNERTPSFMVYPDSSYYCFGCTATGQNAIDFLMSAGYSFNDAVGALLEIK